MPDSIGGREGIIVISLLPYMWTAWELKMAVQALSQICPTESREPEAKLENASDLVAVGLRFDRGRWVVAMDVIICPCGTMT